MHLVILLYYQCIILNVIIIILFFCNVLCSCILFRVLYVFWLASPTNFELHKPLNCSDFWGHGGTHFWLLYFYTLNNFWKYSAFYVNIFSIHPHGEFFKFCSATTSAYIQLEKPFSYQNLQLFYAHSDFDFSAFSSFENILLFQQTSAHSFSWGNFQLCFYYCFSIAVQWIIVLRISGK